MRNHFFMFLIVLVLLISVVACDDDSSSNASDTTDEISNEGIKSSSSNTESYSNGSELPSKGDYISLIGSMVDERDDQVYKIVTIGEQTWMGQNLNYHYIVDQKTYGNYVGDTSHVFDGRFYTWGAAMDSAGIFGPSGKGCGYGDTCKPEKMVRGVCPVGWHLPSRAEWEKLYSTIGNSPNVIKALGFDKWPAATDIYGFSVFPSGEYADGSFNGVGSLAGFWTTDEYNIIYAYQWVLKVTEASFAHGSKENHALSVRCVKDDGTQEIAYYDKRGVLTDDRDGKTYRTTTIGPITLMLDPLDFEYKVDGEVYKNNSVTSRWYVTPYKMEGDTMRGGKDQDGFNISRHYSWGAAMDSAGVFSSDGRGCGSDVICSPGKKRGVCPFGWHVPSWNEWFKLDSIISMRSLLFKEFQRTCTYGTGSDKCAMSWASDEIAGTLLPSRWEWARPGFFESYGPYTAYGTGGGLVQKDKAPGIAFAKDLFVYVVTDKESPHDAYEEMTAMPLRCFMDSPDDEVSSSSSVPKPEVPTTFGSITDSRDGQTYKTVTIGSQTWMAENLNFEDRNKAYGFLGECESEDGNTNGRKYRFGPQEKPGQDLYAPFEEYGEAVTDDGKVKIDVYEALISSICPEGWRLPDTSDVKLLFSAVGESGPNLQAKGYEVWPDANDIYAFSVHPDRISSPNANFWTKSLYDYDDSFAGFLRIRFFNYTWNVNTHGVMRYYEPVNHCLSVRCIKESE